ncbi:unnamed protein product [Cylindrotheca closterium]|uniref:Peptidase C19 ubiquitin carboxyl-terminal hydrolase domain-containing protein n=1 Tax=Cylindrotheca closterium TaxID=2856 RepID=A0AAD2FLN8_9STRA|nr:unnamed protein product [Cylindrotheca closterium]
MAPKQIFFRKLDATENGSSSFLSALQLIAHIVTPIRKGMIHFFLQNRNTSMDQIEWIFLRELGWLFQAMIAAPPDSGKKEANDDEDEEDNSPPVDPTAFFDALKPCLTKYKKKTTPKDASQAVQILLETIQACTSTLPVTGELWNSMLDEASLRFVARQTIVGKTELEDGEVLQRTKKESLILACPYVIPKSAGAKVEESTSVDKLLKEWCAKQPHEYDFDDKSFDFEVTIPVFSKGDASSDGWSVNRTLHFDALNGFLFVGLSRLNDQGEPSETEIEFPKKLDLSKLCTSDVTGSKEFELYGGVLYDDGDYVAALKNSAIKDPEEEGAWQLMESDEIIPMEEGDILEFLKGEGGEGPCGTLAVYRSCNKSIHKQMDNILSDIIISHVSGVLNTKSEQYYYEEVVED